MKFPSDFLWGSATASYQIEGAALTHGRGECIWHRYSHTPGNTYNGDTGDVACDHLNRYRDDVALMKSLGLQAYRFSISWPRVIPAGTGATNPEGLDFYDRLLDELLAAGIQPWATLYHWDLPQALQDRGDGWENPEIVGWFADYTDLMTRRLGDRLHGWITFNEPWCTSILGNLIGRHAPGKQDKRAAYRVAHHLHLSHGAAMQIIRSNCPGALAGITINPSHTVPASDDPKDIQAARNHDGFFNRWFLDPVFFGTYPADTVELLGDVLEGLDLSAVSAAAQPMDFLGVNYYTRAVVRWDDSAWLNAAHVRPEGKYTHMDWEIYPQALTDLLLRLHQDYNPPAMYITENGAAFPEPDAASNGLLDDPDRVEYLRAHLEAAAEAIRQGVPLRGYFVWSLMDNFEWGYGYSKRFGIIHVNYETQQRTLKSSARFYQDLIRQQTG